MKIVKSLAVLTALALTCWPAVAGDESGEAPLALNGHDPVLLTQGEEVLGREEISVTRGWLRYRFADVANKERFESEPERFEVQMEGNCGAMPSGRGNPEIFTVYEEKIYLFASEGCREHFLQEPETFIENYESGAVSGEEG